jgi:hypothetical protein
MFTEKLGLEVQAANRGLTPVRPATTKGTSGIVHSFSFVARGGGVTYCFDIYDNVTEIEVLKTYIKKLDTGYVVNLVSTTGRVSRLGIALAREYGMAILASGETPAFFDVMLMAAQFEKLNRGPRTSRS